MFAAGLPAVLSAAATLVAAPPEQPTLLCWPEGARAGVVEFERRLVDVASPDRLRAWHDLLASEPHVAGTPGDLREVERIAKAFTEMGLEVERHEIWPLLCRPTAMSLEVLSPEHVTLLVKEDILESDPYTANPELTPGWNAYSGNGDVTGEVVYANFGTKEDFRRLAELGVEVKGRLVLARYGGNFRGYKAKFAQEAGAIGLIIYTDPADSGYCKGLMYPEGGFANPTCIQRGSILTLDYPGDPLTPGVEATKDAPRLQEADLALPKIPVMPVGWGSAQQIIGRMKGAAVPAGWQGGLPFPYRLTGGAELKVRLHVEQERFIGKTYNVIGRLKGASEPEKLVIVGCHHDAWGYGAADPLAGTICLMEAARLFSDAAKAGHRPARTMLFCAWGAEEYGIIGSTEWVEANAEELELNGVSYINLDMASMGVDFGCAASPSLHRVIADVAKVVPQARGTEGQMVSDSWTSRSPDAMDKTRPRFGDLGGGSDHEGFVCHVGIASAGLSAGGSQGTSYHSTYDNLQWYRQTVGEDYEPALMVTRMTALAMHRLAYAPVIPLDVNAYPREFRRQLAGASKRGVETGFLGAGGEVATELEGLNAAAGEVEARLGASVLGAPEDPAGLGALNAAILRAERAWLSKEGVPARPWFRSMWVATDEDSGYASWPLPVLRYAIERRDRAALGEAVERYKAALVRFGDEAMKVNAAVR